MSIVKSYKWRIFNGEYFWCKNIIEGDAIKPVVEILNTLAVRFTKKNTAFCVKQMIMAEKWTHPLISSLFSILLHFVLILYF